MPQLSKRSYISWLTKNVHQEWLETLHQSSEVSSILNSIILQNNLLPQLPEIVFLTQYSILKARIMVGKFRLHLNTFRFKLSEHKYFCIDNQHCCHNCQTKLFMIKYSERKHPEYFAVDTTAPLPNFCVHSFIYHLYLNLKNLQLRSLLNTDR